MKGNTLTVGKPAGTDKGRLLKKRIKDNWQLYAMRSVIIRRVRGSWGVNG